MDWRTNQILNQPTMLRHLGLLITGFLLGTLVFGFVNFEQSQEFDQLLWSGGLGALVVYVVVYSNPILNRFLDWRAYTGVRLLLGILWNTLISFALIWSAIWLYGLVSNGTSSVNTIDLEQNLKLVILLFCISVVYNICNFAFYSYNQYTNAQLLELKRERKQAELQLATLKAQLSPHFLFNCINSLSVLFHDNMQKAETFIRSMAKSYQYTLENCRKSLISVKEELDFVESYAFLLSTRFGDAFALQVDLNEAYLNSKIPPLTLQLLVENAVKHNRISHENPIEVKILGDADALVISNNKAVKESTTPSTGIGLKNITGRYKMLSQRSIKIEDNDRFTVTLPLLTNE